MNNLFYFPEGAYNKPAKLYKRYLYKGTGNAKDAEIIAYMSNYVTNDTLRYVFVKKTDKGTYEPLNGLLQGAQTVYLKTNSQLEIVKGDYIWLSNVLFPNGAWFVVGEQVEQMFGYFPNMRKTYQYIQLQRVQGNPNDINN